MNGFTALHLGLLLAWVSGCGGPTTAQRESAPVEAPELVSEIADAAAPAPQGIPSEWPHQTPSVVRSNRGLVVSDEARATRVGRDVLAKGGNAVDAAVATAFALAVTFPTAGNLGGGGFAVVHVNQEVRALDFREVAPAKATRDMFLGSDGKPTGDAHKGIRSAGVPGSVAGLFELHRAHGKTPWTELVAPAVKLAKEGFEVDEAFVETIARAAKKLQEDPTSNALYFPGGQPPKVGSSFKNPELASVLERIAKNGAKGFYAGPTANALAAFMKQRGGLVTAKDLAGYTAKWRPPLTFTYRGQRIVSMPPPSSGGVTLAMMAHILEGYDMRAKGFQSVPSLHYTAEAMRRAFAARNTKLGDPDFVKMPLESLLSEAWAKQQRASIEPERATPSSAIESAGAGSGTGPHTTHFSVIDADGNAVALTTTVNHWFGAGVTVKGGGYILNNEMDDFASVPGEANAFGLVQGEANAIAPNKRMLSSMSPTLVFGEDGKISMVLGAAGGPTIITAVFQQISNVLDFRRPFGEAVYAPRIHMQHMPDAILHEKHGLWPQAAASLRGAGYELVEREHIATAPGIGRDAEGYVGVAEPRRKGALAAAPEP